MEKINYKKDYEYAKSRLRDSLVLFDDKPFYVECIYDDGIVEGYFTNNRHQHLNADLAELDMTPFKMGFSNVSDKCNCSFTYRIPVRHYKQGLTHNSLRYLGHSVGLNSFNLFNTIVGKYPTVFACFESLFNQEWESKAFSRNFALTMKNAKGLPKILFRSEVVGEAHFIGDKQVKLVLDDEAIFLQELLQGEVNV